MNHRNLSILVGTLCLGIAAGMAVFTQDSLATSSLEDLDYLQPPTTEPVASGETLDAAPAEGAFRPSAGPVAVAGEDRQQDTSGWTSGIIRGDVQLAVSVLDPDAHQCTSGVAEECAHVVNPNNPNATTCQA